MAIQWKRQWEVTSDTNPNKVYIVSEGYDGHFACGCPAWTRNMPRTDCKHIRRVKHLLDASGIRMVG